MTELDLAVELDLCDSEVIIVVSTCKIARCNRTYKEDSWSNLDSRRQIQWCDVGNSSTNDLVQSHKDNALDVNDMNCPVDIIEESTTPHNESTTEECLETVFHEKEEQVPITISHKSDLIRDDILKDDRSTPCSNIDDEKSQNKSSLSCAEHDAALTLSKLGASVAQNEIDSTYLRSKHTHEDHVGLAIPDDDTHEEGTPDGNLCEGQYFQISSRSHDNDEVKVRRKNKKPLCKNDLTSEDETVEEEEWEEDENPWLGCICGKTHESPTNVFWIQCDECDAWYNCAPKCIGFSKHEAESKGKWKCPECSSTTEESSTDIVMNMTAGSITPIAETKIFGREKIVFSVGTIVEVEDRTWRGSNKPGGVAKIIAVHERRGDEDFDEIFYDVQYVLESRKESDVESHFISINQNVLPDLSSPAGSTRSTRGRGMRRGVQKH